MGPMQTSMRPTVRLHRSCRGILPALCLLYSTCAIATCTVMITSKLQSCAMPTLRTIQTPTSAEGLLAVLARQISCMSLITHVATCVAPSDIVNAERVGCCFR